MNPIGNSLYFYFVKDIPIGLLDDIYDFLRKFGERLDEIEDVVNENRLFGARTKGIGIITSEQALNLGLTYERFSKYSWSQG